MYSSVSSPPKYEESTRLSTPPLTTWTITTTRTRTRTRRKRRTRRTTKSLHASPHLLYQLGLTCSTPPGIKLPNSHTLRFIKETVQNWPKYDNMFKSVWYHSFIVIKWQHIHLSFSWVLKPGQTSNDCSC